MTEREKNEKQTDNELANYNPANRNFDQTDVNGEPDSISGDTNSADADSGQTKQTNQGTDKGTK
jgi:hypothetical protein